MFTGIVRELGRAQKVDDVNGGARLTVTAHVSAERLRIGDSVALNGCCLTVTSIDGSRLTFDAVPETLERTSLGTLANESLVNVEPALRVGDSLGGHIVQGHVDELGEITALEAEGQGKRMTIAASEDVLRYCVYKGSITVDGVSLTVARLAGSAFDVALIPHTLEVTNLGGRAVGDTVNLEVDVLAKHVERLTRAYLDAGSR